MKKKLTTVAVLVLVLATVLCACGGGNEIPSTKEEALVVGTCGEHEIRHEELRYFTMNYKAEMEAMYGEGIFEGADSAMYQAELLAKVSSAIEKNYALVDLFATKDIHVSDKKIQNTVEEYVAATVEDEGGQEEYAKFLAENYLTDAVYRLHIAIMICQEQYYAVIAEEQDRQAYDAVLAGEGFIRCKSIFVENNVGENVESNRALAQKVRDEIAAGADIDDYIGTVANQDTGNCDYYFMRGYFLEEYEEAAFALEVGEVSDVVQVLDGFYVIVREEIEEGYFQSNLNELKVMYHLCTMENQMQAIAQTLSLDLNQDIDLISME